MNWSASAPSFPDRGLARLAGVVLRFSNPKHRVAKSLEDSRQELLDLSTRNRLLSIPDESRSAPVVRAVHELSAEVLRMLCLDKKELVLIAGEEEAFLRRVARVNESPKDTAVSPDCG